MGLESVSGAWTLSEANELTVSISMMGKSQGLKASLEWQDGLILMRDLSSGRVEKFGKYEGPLPPGC